MGRAPFILSLMPLEIVGQGCPTSLARRDKDMETPGPQSPIAERRRARIGLPTLWEELLGGFCRLFELLFRGLFLLKGG